MSQETRQKANRSTVADLLDKAARQLTQAMKTVSAAQEMLQAVQEAEKLATTASKLARAKPVAGTRMLPAPVRRKTERAVATLQKLARDIRQTPVTKDEKVLSTNRKARRKVAA